LICGSRQVGTSAGCGRERGVPHTNGFAPGVSTGESTMKSRLVSVISQGWFAAVTGFLLFNIAAANAQTPTIASITPATALAGGPAFKITVTGTNYGSTSVVRWNGSDRVTNLSTPSSTTALEAAITAADIAAPGTAQVTVFNPGPAGGQTSNIVTFTITGVAP